MDLILVLLVVLLVCGGGLGYYGRSNNASYGFGGGFGLGGIILVILVIYLIAGRGGL